MNHFKQTTDTDLATVKQKSKSTSDQVLKLRDDCDKLLAARKEKAPTVDLSGINAKLADLNLLCTVNDKQILKLLEQMRNLQPQKQQ